MSTNQHIFLVEDDLSFGAVLKSYLELNDYEVTWVDDGKRAMEKFRGNMSQVARELGISRATLYNKIERYGI